MVFDRRSSGHAFAAVPGTVPSVPIIMTTISVTLAFAETFLALLAPALSKLIIGVVVVP